jgi:EAL domain-containing protein (putative c-di-GMP-specific phosphodiesterase class I)
LQESKSNGKNQYQLFNESMRSRLTARLRLEQDLKIALQEGQFEVYFQPKINIETRRITGSEALVRWKHPTNGFISPEIFVPVAEEAGMIIELGEWILRTACKETHELQQVGYEGLNVAVNISAVQFTDGNLLPMISKALKDSRLSPQFLELEITESAVMHDPEEVINSLHELSQFGMSLAIDDFGTGYSSLAYLKRFPVDTLKIDRAFITDISSDNDDVAIVEAVLGLGKHFNMKVIAEGVEDEEQLQFLKAQGCDIAQGYYISKPMDAQAYREWLDRWPYGVQGTTLLDNLPKVSGADFG